MTSDFSTEERPARERQAEIAQRIAGISETRVLQHIKRLEGAKHATTTPEALQSGADYILTQMKRIGLDPIKERIDGEGDQSFINLIGRLAGDRTGREILVVVAHYDTVAESPGADDNASGLAVLLEVARILSPMRGKLTLQFVAFSLEEEGLLGSDHYVRRVRRNKIPLWGAIVMECVGYIDHRLGSQKTPEGFPFALPERGDFIGLVGNEAAAPIKEAFESAVKRYCPTLPCVSFLVPGKGERFPDTRRSDHVPFWDRGYRAVMLTDTANFRNPHYHQKSDRLETLDISFISGVARALAAAVIKLAELRLPSRSPS